YENNLSGGITATSPLYNCANATNVQLQFKRWLGVESSQYDKATVEVWNGSSWQIVWTNPTADLTDSSWQDVSYDVWAWAAGHPRCRSAGPGRRVPSPTQWPGDSYFADVTTSDIDGSASNASYTEPLTPLDTPLPGAAFFYLVVDMGTNGLEGPKGWQG